MPWRGALRHVKGGVATRVTETRGTKTFSAQWIAKVLGVGTGALTLHSEAMVDLFSREICQERPSLLSPIEK